MVQDDGVASRIDNASNMKDRLEAVVNTQEKEDDDDDDEDEGIFL
jgi:hypothetical protein